MSRSDLLNGAMVDVTAHASDPEQVPMTQLQPPDGMDPRFTVWGCVDAVVVHDSVTNVYESLDLPATNLDLLRAAWRLEARSKKVH